MQVPLQRFESSFSGMRIGLIPPVLLLTPFVSTPSGVSISRPLNLCQTISAKCARSAWWSKQPRHDHKIDGVLRCEYTQTLGASEIFRRRSRARKCASVGASGLTKPQLCVRRLAASSTERLVSIAAISVPERTIGAHHVCPKQSR